MPTFHSDGQPLAYREAGQGDPLLVLPGNTSSSALHVTDLNYFAAAGYHAASPDFPGTGASPRVAAWPGDWFTRCAHATAALIEHLGGGPAVLVGTSGGAGVALHTAALYPERVRAVVADSEVMIYPPDLLRAELANRAQRTDGQRRFWEAAHGPDWEQVVDADSAMLRFLADEEGGRLPFSRCLEDVRCPVLLTATLDDSLLPPDVGQQVVAMLARLPSARAYLTRGGDHPLMWSKPKEFRRIMAQFLENLPRPA
jgi:pimeloyl-ACP methyl ester carboxylesterase